MTSCNHTQTHIVGEIPHKNYCILMARVLYMAVFLVTFSQTFSRLLPLFSLPGELMEIPCSLYRGNPCYHTLEFFTEFSLSQCRTEMGKII